MTSPSTPQAPALPAEVREAMQTIYAKAASLNKAATALSVQADSLACLVNVDGQDFAEKLAPLWPTLPPSSPQAALGVRDGEPLALYRKIEANARSLRETAMESMSASPPEGYDELEGRPVEIADECCRDGLMAMQTAILNFLYDQMTEGQKDALAATKPISHEQQN